MFDGLEDEARYCLALAVKLTAEDAARQVTSGQPDPLHRLTDGYRIPMLAKELMRVRHADLFLAAGSDWWDEIECDLNQAVADLLPEPESENYTVLCTVCGLDYWGADFEQARYLHDLAEDHACQPGECGSDIGGDAGSLAA
ncbi:hypothetical protein [Micromonospora sp. NPDC000442]|uniref:hypothetical protein n=1 Tax=Micromonospora sp. NPDC000442 TaxID=3364217 RepID=UPI003694256C